MILPHHPDLEKFRGFSLQSHGVLAHPLQGGANGENFFLRILQQGLDHPPIAEGHGAADGGHQFLVVFDAKRVLDGGVDIGNADGIFVHGIKFFSGAIGGAMDVAGAEAAAGECH